MADIKTTLRELSVIVGIVKEVNNISYLNTPHSFAKICKMTLHDVSFSYYFDVENLSEFNEEQKRIIENGFNLSHIIIQKFKITELNEINWYGFDAHKDEPYDISVNNLKFSLKEESFILENMGLYKLLNCYTGSKYKKRHIFNDYARKEYEKWFDVTWSELLKLLRDSNGMWLYDNLAKNKKGVIKLVNDQVYLTYYISGEKVASSILPLNCTLSIFEKNTIAKTREEVFSKFIHFVLDNNVNYNAAKKACAVSAANALAKELTDNLNYHAGLPRFLRIHNLEYYYAKTTAAGIELYKVPSLNDFEDNIVIESIVPSVPDKQANILTTIRNKKTGRSLVLRNECRFSHGQFNGTPEAKLYYEYGGSLLTVYEPV